MLNTYSDITMGSISGKNGFITYFEVVAFMVIKIKGSISENVLFQRFLIEVSTEKGVKIYRLR